MARNNLRTVCEIVYNRSSTSAEFPDKKMDRNWLQKLPAVAGGNYDQVRNFANGRNTRVRDVNARGMGAGRRDAGALFETSCQRTSAKSGSGHSVRRCDHDSWFVRTRQAAGIR